MIISKGRWFSQLTKITIELDRDLEEAGIMDRKTWKRYVEKKTIEHTKKRIKTMIQDTRNYNEIQGKEIIAPGMPKPYYMKKERQLQLQYQELEQTH